MTTCLYCQRSCLSVLLHLKQPNFFQFLSLKALSTVSDPLLVFAEHRREEGQGYLNVYIPGCNGLVLPADIFISVQVQGQILLMSGICELLLYTHTLPNCHKLFTRYWVHGESALAWKSCSALPVLVDASRLPILCEAGGLLDMGSALQQTPLSRKTVDAQDLWTVTCRDPPTPVGWHNYLKTNKCSSD